MSEENKVTEENSKKFEKYKEDIRKAINEKLWKTKIEEEGWISIIYWVWMLPMNSDISNNIYLWTSLPVIIVIWNNSWRLYFFSLKTLLPNIFD